MSNYSEKLKSPKWQKKRLEILSRDKWKCKLCSDTETTLNVHHLKYTKEPWNAPNIDLITLCEHCHSMISFYKLDILQIIKLIKFKDIFGKNKNDIGFIFRRETNTSYVTIINNKIDVVAVFKNGSKVLSELYKLNKNG